jgi:sulfoxide reductase heme-binding subunit YedZ
MTLEKRCCAGGWPLVGWSAGIIAAMVTAIIALFGWNEYAVRLVLRATARVSLILFTSAFIASPLHRRWPNLLSSWLLGNRRYLGVSFAVSHYFHLAAIITLARLAPEGFRRDVDAFALVFGGLAYVLLTAMTLTSFDRTAAWIGPRAWRILHTTGVYYIWLIFFISYLPRSIVSIAYAPLAIITVAALALRLPLGHARPPSQRGKQLNWSWRSKLRLPNAASYRAPQ